MKEKEPQSSELQIRHWKIAYTYLREKIIKGEFPTWSPLPSTEVLIRDHGIGRSSIQRAVSALAEEGLIERRAGAGCYVLPPKEIRLTEIQKISCRKLQAVLASCKESGMTRREIDYIIDSYFSIKRE